MNNLNEGEEALTWFENFVSIILKEKDVKKVDKKNTQTYEVKVVVNEWSKEEIAKLTKAILKYPVGMANRWELMAKFIGGKKTNEEVTKMVMQLKSKTKVGPDMIQAELEKNLEENKKQQEILNKEKQDVSINKNGKTDDKPKGDEWSQDQQRRLEGALKRFKPSMDAAERWAKISDAVGDGKTKKDCLNRVKVIKANLKNDGKIAKK